MNKNSAMIARLKTWSAKGISKRIYHILSHYGITSEKLNRSIFDFYYLLNKYNITPTFPVTASVLNRIPDIFKDLGVEFAIHGYRHIDYTKIGIDIFLNHLNEAAALFRKHGIEYKGYRFPYLRCDPERIRLIKEFGFEWIAVM